MWSLSMHSEYAFVCVCVLLTGTEKTLVGTLASILAQLLAVLVIILIGKPIQEMATRYSMNCCMCNGKSQGIEIKWLASLALGKKKSKSAGWRLWKGVSSPGFEPGEFD